LYDPPVRFHAIMRIRDEGDIIAQNLRHHLTWADALHVLDTGSVDDTWEIVRSIAREDRRVNLLGREPIRYCDGLLAYVFDRARTHFRDGDWIARPDADEFFEAPPPRFVRERLERGEGLVRVLMHEFVLTRSDVLAWDEGRESLADRARPIQERRLRYYLDPYPEVRLFRYRRGMRWPITRTSPWHPGLIAYERIPVRHYRCRDVAQVRLRCAIRRAMIAGTPASMPIGEHWRHDWEYWIWPDDNPRLRTLPLGASLPESRSPRSSAGTAKRRRQEWAYRLGLARLAQLNKPGWDRAIAHQPLTPDFQQRIRETMDRLQPQH
jgi:hypothetical protein